MIVLLQPLALQFESLQSQCLPDFFDSRHSFVHLDPSKTPLGFLLQNRDTPFHYFKHATIAAIAASVPSGSFTRTVSSPNSFAG